MNILTIQSFKDGTKAREFLSYGTRDEALSAFYYKLWASVGNTDIVNVIVEVITDDGNVAKRETYTRFLPPEPVEIEVSE